MPGGVSYRAFTCIGLIAVLVSLLAAACADGSSEAPLPYRVVHDPCKSEGRLDGATPEDLLSDCAEFSQPLYWLGQELRVPGLPVVRLSSSYTGPDEQPTTPRTYVVLGYGPERSTPIEVKEWYKPTWEEYTAQFTGYDPSTVPETGPVNWWQHPCVEEEIYRAGNGGAVHLFRAHLEDVMTILPMSRDEVANCLTRPSGVIGAHVHFDETVIELYVGLEGGSPYGTEEAVRHLVESLHPYHQ